MNTLKGLWRDFNLLLDIVEPFSDQMDEEILLVFDHIVMSPDIVAVLCVRDLKIHPIEAGFSAPDMYLAHREIQRWWYSFERAESYLADFFWRFGYHEKLHMTNKLCENYNFIMGRDMALLEWAYPRTDLIMYLVPSPLRNYVQTGFMSSDCWAPLTREETNTWKIEHYNFAENANPTVILKYQDLSLYLKRICWQLSECIDTPRSPWNLEDHGHFTEDNPCGLNWVTMCERLNHQDTLILNTLSYYDYTVRVTLYDYSIALEFYDKVDYSILQVVHVMA